jgi:hypothetical protein
MSSGFKVGVIQQSSINFTRLCLPVVDGAVQLRTVSGVLPQQWTVAYRIELGAASSEVGAPVQLLYKRFSLDS